MNNIEALAKNLVDYSLSLKSGDTLVIENFKDSGRSIINALQSYCRELNIKIHLLDHNPLEYVEKVNALNKKQMISWAQKDVELLKSSEAYLMVSTDIGNSRVFNSLSKAKRDRYENIYYKVVHNDCRMKMPWSLTEIPEENEISKIYFTEQELLDYYYLLCNIDYKRLSRSAESLVKKLDKASQIIIMDKNTELSFSIENIPSFACMGRNNMPDGEVYTAPIKESVEGYITYNLPSYEASMIFEDIHFDIKKGKIVNAYAKNKIQTEKLNEELDKDKGARYFGEFALGINPLAKYPIGNTLIDEKLVGSFHLTPGCCYEEAYNGNESLLHWDLVSSHLEEYGGGRIYLDGTLFRKDGYFIDEELEDLNPKLKRSK